MKKLKAFAVSHKDEIIKWMKTVAGFIPAAIIGVIAFTSMLSARSSDDGILPLDCLLFAASYVCALLSLLLSFRVKKIYKAVKWSFAVITPYLSFLLIELIRDNPFSIDWDIVFLNLSFFVLIGITAFFIFGRTAPAEIITIALPFAFGIVSHFIREFRGTPLFPWDLASYGTAAEVIGTYKITFSPRVATVVSLFILSLHAAVKFNVKPRMKRAAIIRPACAVLSAALLLGVGKYVQTDKAQREFGLYPYLFTPDVLYGCNGFAVGFLMNLRYTTVDVPAGYSPDDIHDKADEYPSDEYKKPDDDSITPNVVVIMNETFSDMKALCDYTTNEEYLPFISSLDENAVKGIVHSSVVGGNTPNSEFEFLTGMTMGFLPAGSIAYQQFIKSQRPSFATQMSDLGYNTVAMHPYWASGWDRKDVYPLLGFDETLFIDDNSFAGLKYLRGYVSDLGVFKKISTFFEKKDDDPLFVFAVTMQNHSGYSTEYENFTPEITVDGLEDNFEVSTYMSLIRESDAAFEWLINYFTDYDEPTIVLMFGDHQPNNSIAAPLLKAAGEEYSDDDLEKSENRYIVPYVMWANYDIKTDAPNETSINYLSSILTEAAGIPQTGAQKQAAQLMKKYPVINGRCFIDDNGVLSPISEYIFDDDLLSYARMQYNYLFDPENIVEKMWRLDGAGVDTENDAEESSGIEGANG